MFDKKQREKIFHFKLKIRYDGKLRSNFVNYFRNPRTTMIIVLNIILLQEHPDQFHRKFW
jgi:hypothetical protein